jgi:hypothetical protein
MNDPCADCGSTTYVASLVDVDGVRTCAACFIGLTPLVRAGIAIAATPGELGKRDKGPAR